MIDKLILGITQSLKQTFGWPVYADRAVTQGLETPCFFAAVLNPTEKPLLGNRCIRRYPVDIQYYPADASCLRDCYQTAERLFDVTRLLYLSDSACVRGLQPRFEMVEGVVLFHVCFDFVLSITSGESETMEQLELEYGLGGE